MVHLRSILFNGINPHLVITPIPSWRSDIDDIGQAVLIASTAVESYTDNVGSAATKYYWARQSVTKA